MPQWRGCDATLEGTETWQRRRASSEGTPKRGCLFWGEGGRRISGRREGCAKRACPQTPRIHRGLVYWPPGGQSQVSASDGLLTWKSLFLTIPEAGCCVQLRSACLPLFFLLNKTREVSTSLSVPPGQLTHLRASLLQRNF